MMIPSLIDTDKVLKITDTTPGQDFEFLVWIIMGYFLYRIIISGLHEWGVFGEPNEDVEDNDDDDNKEE